MGWCPVLLMGVCCLATTQAIFVQAFFKKIDGATYTGAEPDHTARRASRIQCMAVCAQYNVCTRVYYNQCEPDLVCCYFYEDATLGPLSGQWIVYEKEANNTDPVVETLEPCQPGFDHYGTANCYTITPRNDTNQVEADAECQAYGADCHLANFETLEEFTVVVANLPTDQGLWVGAAFVADDSDGGGKMLWKITATEANVPEMYLSYPPFITANFGMFLMMPDKKINPMPNTAWFRGLCENYAP